MYFLNKILSKTIPKTPYELKKDINANSTIEEQFVASFETTT